MGEGCLEKSGGEAAGERSDCPLCMSTFIQMSSSRLSEEGCYTLS